MQTGDKSNSSDCSFKSMHQILILTVVLIKCLTKNILYRMSQITDVDEVPDQNEKIVIPLTRAKSCLPQKLSCLSPPQPVQNNQQLHILNHSISQASLPGLSFYCLFPLFAMGHASRAFFRCQKIARK